MGSPYSGFAAVKRRQALDSLWELLTKSPGASGKKEAGTSLGVGFFVVGRGKIIREPYFDNRWDVM
jgi:hypothetical protein